MTNPPQKPLPHIAAMFASNTVGLLSAMRRAELRKLTSIGLHCRKCGDCGNIGGGGGVCSLNRVYLEAETRVLKRKSGPKTYTYLQETTSK